jgi:hypothetical protein
MIHSPSSLEAARDFPARLCAALDGAGVQCVPAFVTEGAILHRYVSFLVGVTVFTFRQCPANVRQCLANVQHWIHIVTTLATLAEKFIKSIKIINMDLKKIKCL